MIDISQGYNRFIVWDRKTSEPREVTESEYYEVVGYKDANKVETKSLAVLKGAFIEMDSLRTKYTEIQIIDIRTHV